MHFFHALKQAQKPIVNEVSIRSFGWEDDGEDGLALRVITEDDQTILVYNTDKIIANKDREVIVVSIGATDHEFVV